MKRKDDMICLYAEWSRINAYNQLAFKYNQLVDENVALRNEIGRLQQELSNNSTENRENPEVHAFDSVYKNQQQVIQQLKLGEVLKKKEPKITQMCFPSEST